MIGAVNHALASMFDATTDPPVGAAEPSQPHPALPLNGAGMGRDEFLKLLVAQMKNQDPLNPMDGKDMVAQLAQFSSVEQLISINASTEATKTAQQGILDTLDELQKSQEERADELSRLVEGQMAVSTVGKVAVTPGNNVFVDRDGNGSVVVDTGTRGGAGRLSIVNDKGEVLTSRDVGYVGTGQQSIDLRDAGFDPPLKAGKYSYRFEVATDGGQYQSVKTYTTGRITGLRYEQGNPILIIGDSLQLPMSQLTQIRG